MFGNEKYNKLTPIEEVGRNKSGCVLYKYICDCGKQSIHARYRVRNGSIVSCGCSRKKKRNPDNVLKRIYRDYFYGARNRELLFELSFEDFQILSKQNCYYCDDPPSFRNRKGNIIMNGIDRVNSKEGYFKENCVSCCSSCNKMKNNLSLDIFLDRVFKIVKKFKK